MGVNLTQNPVEDIDDKLVQQILNQSQPLDFSASDLANRISKFVNEIGLNYEGGLLVASRNSELLQKILQQQTLKQAFFIFESRFPSQIKYQLIRPLAFLK